MNKSTLIALARLAVVILPGLPLSATSVSNLRVLSTNATQIVIAYTASDSGACTVEVSESASYMPLVHDVNGAFFPGANLDTRAGTLGSGSFARTFVIGLRKTEPGADGRNYSRALQQDTAHHIRVCGSATLTARTAPIAYGKSVREPLQVHPNFPGSLIYPSFSFTDRNEVVVDPDTGLGMRRISIPGDIKYYYANNFSDCTGTNWTGVGPCLAVTGGQTSYSGVGRDWLYLDFGLSRYTESAIWIQDPLLTNPQFAHAISFTVSAVCTGADCSTSAAREIEVALTFDNGITSSPLQTLTVPTSEANITLCSSGGSATCVPGNFWGDRYHSPNEITWSTGVVYTSGSSTTLTFTNAADCSALSIGRVINLKGNPGSSESWAVSRTIQSKNCAGPTAVVDTAIDLTPTGIPRGGWPYWYKSGWAVNPDLKVMIRKKSTTHTDATISIRNPTTVIQKTAGLPGSSGGMIEHCAPTPRSDGYYRCLFQDRLIGIHPNGTVKMLGTLASGTGWGASAHGSGTKIYQTCGSGGNASVAFEDSDSLWCFAQDSGTSGGRIYKVVLSGIPNTDVLPSYPTETFTLVGNSSMWTDMLGQDITSILQAYEPTFNPAKYNCGMDAYVGNRYVGIFCRRGGQDTKAWFFVYDLGNKLPLWAGGTGAVIAAFPPAKSGSIMAWNGLHTSFSPRDMTKMVWSQSFYQKNESVGNEAYRTIYSDYWNGSAWVAGTLNSSDTTSRVRLTSTWNGAWGSTPAGFISGDPLYTGTDLGGSDRWLQHWAVGDIVLSANNEYWEITAINGQDANGIDLTVTRGYGGSAKQTVASGGVVTAFHPFNSDGGTVVWDFLNDPNGSSRSHQWMLGPPGGGHTVILDKYIVATDMNTYIYPNGISGDVASGDRVYYQDRETPGFAGQSARAQGDMYEMHPSFIHDKSRVRQWAVDAHPFIGGSTSDGSNVATHVSGSLWKYASCTPPKPKHHPTLASCGFSVLKDISSAATGNIIQGDGTTNFTYCIAAAANECRTGSVAGDVYVDCLNITPDHPLCLTNSASRGDICIMPHNDKGSSVVLYELPGATANYAKEAKVLHDRAFTRLTSNIFGATKAFGNTWNSKILSTSGWALVGEGSLGINAPGVRASDMIIPLPKPTFDSTNRASFIPVKVTLGSVPAETTNVFVEFGYREFDWSGSMAVPPCTTRQESCVASQAVVNEAVPFQWSSESPSGLSCAAGCTLTVPAVAGRTVYYRVVYRDAANQVLARGPLQATAVH